MTQVKQLRNTMNAALRETATAPRRLGQPHGHRRVQIHRVRRTRSAALGRSFQAMGFKPVARHRTRTCCCTARARINFIVNAEPDSFAQRFARLHGPSVCAIAFRVHDAKAAYERAISLGAWGYAGKAGPGELNIPAIKGHWRQPDLFCGPLARQGRAQPGDIGNIGF